MALILELETESEVWRRVKHALREAGYKSFLQPNLFDATRANLFLEPRSEPQGGHLNRGFLVFPGSCEAGSHSEREVQPYVIEEKPAAKSSTNVLNASVCQSCGCKLDGQPLKKVCTCRC